MSVHSKNLYNERLFSSGFRKYLHLGRFGWLQQVLKQLNYVPTSVVELGCFDGKTINFFPAQLQRYLGLDANWGGGLDLAKQIWKAYPHYTFDLINTSDHIPCLEQKFDCAVAMETLEHLPPDQVKPFLVALKNITKDYIFITVPNEKGLVFLVKFIVKRLMYTKSVDYAYSFREIVNATLGRVNRVERVVGSHKGFDYSTIIKEVGNEFKIVCVMGYPFSFLPPCFNFGVGIVANCYT